jgi:hypothetical protein
MDAVAITAADVTPELVMELLRPSEVALSADGSRIAFGVSASFREQGKLIETRLWTGDVDGELRLARRARCLASRRTGRRVPSGSFAEFWERAGAV